MAHRRYLRSGPCFLQKCSSSMNEMNVFCEALSSIEYPLMTVSLIPLRLIFLNRNPIPERREWCMSARAALIGDW